MDETAGSGVAAAARMVAASKLDDRVAADRVYAEIARSTVHWRERCDAVDAIKDERVLADIAVLSSMSSLPSTRPSASTTNRC